MTIETILAANGLYIAGSAYLMNGQLIQITNELKNISEHIRPKTRFVVDAHYGVSDEILEATPENGMMQIIGRDHVWTLHIGNLSDKEQKVLFARMKPSALYDVVTQMETLVRDYGCSYELDDKGDIVSKSTYEEDETNKEAVAKLEDAINKSNDKIDELTYHSNNTRSGYWGLSALGILTVIGSAVLITIMQAPAIILGIIGIAAGIGMMIGGGVLQSKANAQKSPYDATLITEIQKRDELIKEKDRLLEKLEKSKNSSRP